MELVGCVGVGHTSVPPLLLALELVPEDPE